MQKKEAFLFPSSNKAADSLGIGTRRRQRTLEQDLVRTVVLHVRACVRAPPRVFCVARKRATAAICSKACDVTGIVERTDQVQRAVPDT